MFAFVFFRFSISFTPKGKIIYSFPSRSSQCEESGILVYTICLCKYTFHDCTNMLMMTQKLTQTKNTERKEKYFFLSQFSLPIFKTEVLLILLKDFLYLIKAGKKIVEQRCAFSKSHHAHIQMD